VFIPPTNQTQASSGANDENRIQMVSSFNITPAPRERKEIELISKAREAISSVNQLPEALSQTINLDIEYLLTEYRDEIQVAINTLRRKEFYSLDDYNENRIFGSRYNVKTAGAKIPLDIDLRLEAQAENKFRMIKSFRNTNNSHEIKALIADVIIDPMQDHFAYIKRLSYYINGSLFFAAEEVPQENQNQVPDSLVTLDLSPQSRQN
jgi:hypothetical protein